MLRALLCSEGLVAALVLQAYLQEAIDEEEAADQEVRCAALRRGAARQAGLGWAC